MTEQTSSPFNSWAILETREGWRIGGLVEEQEIGGAIYFHVSVFNCESKLSAIYFISPSRIFSLIPCNKEMALAVGVAHEINQQQENTMPKFRKKPVTIEAHQITKPMQIQTLEGVHQCSPGDWLITGVKGEKYCCKADIFAATYEPVDDEAKAAWIQAYEPEGDQFGDKKMREAYATGTTDDDTQISERSLPHFFKPCLGDPNNRSDSYVEMRLEQARQTFSDSPEETLPPG